MDPSRTKDLGNKNKSMCKTSSNDGKKSDRVIPYMDVAKPKHTEDLDDDELPRCTKSKVNGMDPSLVSPYTNKTESILKKL